MVPTSNAEKGERFHHWLTWRLLRTGEFCAGVPQPFAGDDLWVKRTEAVDSPVHRSQLKAAYWSRPCKDGLRFLFNDNQERFQANLKCPYLYFFGLWSVKRATYDIGCIPSSFFVGLPIRVAGGKKRPVVMLDFMASEDGSAFRFDWNLRVDVTPFFQTFAAIT